MTIADDAFVNPVVAPAKLLEEKEEEEEEEKEEEDEEDGEERDEEEGGICWELAHMAKEKSRAAV